MENWRDDLETWLAPFVAALGHKTRARMCPDYIAGLIGPGDRKSVQPMRGTGRSAMVDCITSQLTGSGTARRWRRRFWPQPTGWSAARMPFWSSMIPAFPRKGTIRSGLRRNMPHRWARPRIASRWFP